MYLTYCLSVSSLQSQNEIGQGKLTLARQNIIKKKLHFIETS